MNEDEVGDALFALLALCDSVGVDAAEALDTALQKCGQRQHATGNVASGDE